MSEGSGPPPTFSARPDDPWGEGDEIRFRRIQANGLEFPALEAGKGPLVLCLHGFPDHPGTWRPLLKQLAAAGCWAVAPALRGYWPDGAAPDGSYRPSANAQDLLAIIRALGRSQADLIGHDLGARGIYAAASLAPHRVRRVVGLSVPYGSAVGRAFLSDGEQQRRSWYMFFFQTRMAEAAVRHGDFALVDRLWREWSPGFRASPAERAALHSVLAAHGVVPAALAYYRQMFAGVPDDPDAQALETRASGPIAAPALYLHGADDGCIAAAHSEGMEPLFRGGLQRVVMEGVGHFLHLERPREVASQITSFLLADPQ